MQNPHDPAPDSAAEPISAGETASPSEPVSGPVEVPRPNYRWYHKLGAVMAAILCFELGVFLLVYPWAGEWEANAWVIPWWGRELWNDPFFRGAVSGLGLLNIWISFAEVFRFRRFTGS